MKFLKGKKTYITAAVTGGIAAAQVLGVAVPDYAITLLAAFGLYSVRSAISNDPFAR